MKDESFKLVILPLGGLAAPISASPKPAQIPGKEGTSSLGTIRTRTALPRQVRSFWEKTRENLPLILLGALFVLGALCGSGLYRTMSPKTSSMLMLLLSGSGTGEEFHFFADWGAVFLANFAMVALLFLCGFCAISQPVIVLIPFVKGLGFGLVAAYNMVLLSPYSSFFWLKFMPGAFLATALILMCAKQSLGLSCYVCRSVFCPPSGGGAPRQAPRPTSLVGLYGMKYLFFVLVCAAFSLIDVLFDLAYAVVTG